MAVAGLRKIVNTCETTMLAWKEPTFMCKVFLLTS